ncbi:MAG TPA: carboxypeptidase regulatory-like domain-containing protein [Pyrinomonadaceae bacterium]
MNSLIRAVLCFALSTAFVTCALAQDADGNRGQGGVVTGRVTVEGRPATGVRVWPAPASPADRDPLRAPRSASVTDAEGKFRLTGVPAGTYSLAVAGAYVVRASDRAKAVTVKDGQEAGGFELTLERGGVITGRVLDAEGQPLIGARVSSHVLRESAPRLNVVLTYNSAETDDRGVYRLYGLPAGRYTISLTPRLPPGAGGPPPVTYYPGVTDESKAESVEVKAGDEKEDIDITLGRRDDTFSVTGRVVEDETGKPVPGIGCDYAELNRLAQGPPPGCKTDAKGEFRIERVRPGRYVMFTVAEPGGDFYSEPTAFEVASGDIQGLEVKVRRGSTITGTALVEGNDPAGRAALSQLTVLATQQGEPSVRGAARATIGADGKFLIKSVKPGKVTFIITSYPRQDFTLIRVEQNGAEQARGIDVVAGEPVAGVRLILSYGKGSVRGRIRAQGGTLPEGTRVMVSIAPAGSPGRALRSARVDDAGEFFLRDVPTGDYELTALVILPMVPGARLQRVPPIKQPLSVKNNSETEVTVVVNLSQ